jgi:hypothetical protein
MGGERRVQPVFAEGIFVMNPRIPFPGLWVAVAALWLPMSIEAADVQVSIARSDPWEVEWTSTANFDYRLESTLSLISPAWEPVVTNLAGTGAMLKAADPRPLASQRFYRVVGIERTGPQISPAAVEPVVGQVYPEGTLMGSSFLGRQFTIPPKWKAGLREGASSLLIVSDTEPGLVIQFTSLAGTGAQISAQLGQSFYVGQFGGFELVGSPQLTGSNLNMEWRGVGFTDDFESLEGIGLKCQAVIHPSGGVVAFVGLFTEPNRAVMQRVLNDLGTSVITVPRNTRTDLVNAIAGKSFTWVKAANTGNGGTSGSLQRWTEKNAFFCAATYEITTQSESSFSGNLSGGGFYTGYSNSSSTEAGDWTIIDTPSGPAMVMISSTGSAAAFIQITGNSVIFGDQQFDFRAPHSCPSSAKPKSKFLSMLLSEPTR